jgi:UDP-N-acetylglucosamine 2-epimerase (non-hydrolysing)
LIREGYPEENIYVVGNTVVDAIDIKRRMKGKTSIFDLYPALKLHSHTSKVVRDEWIRVDIHRRENLTRFRFLSIIEAIIKLVELGYKVVLIKSTATQHALMRYDLVHILDQLARDYPNRFVQTPLWKDYGSPNPLHPIIHVALYKRFQLRAEKVIHLKQ